MGRLGRSLMQRDRITTIDEHVERLRAVTAADVARVLHRVLDGPRALAAVGPFEVERARRVAEASVYASHRPSGGAKEIVRMGFLDKAAAKVSEATKAAQDGIAEQTAKRKADGLLRELGAWTYAKHKGGFDDADANIARVLGRAGRPRGRARRAGRQGGAAARRPAAPAAASRRRRLRRRRAPPPPPAARRRPPPPPPAAPAAARADRPAPPRLRLPADRAAASPPPPAPASGRAAPPPPEPARRRRLRPSAGDPVPPPPPAASCPADPP